MAKADPLARRTISVKEFADVFGIDVERVYRWCRAGRLKHMRRGQRGRIHIDIKEIDRVMEDGFPEDPRNAERRAA